ncbi:MAG TPA: hypothetical protein VHF69_11630 [Candidatus Synoicihabitans sp.]|nr:hypothetical protein [Candidatus Synoicihabitans sp.]
MNFSGSDLQQFQEQAATERRELWPCTVALAGTAAPTVDVSKGPARQTKERVELGAGVKQLVECVMLFPSSATGDLVPSLQKRFVITALPRGPSQEVGTVWRVTDLSLGMTGREHRVVLQRVDS